MTAYTCSICRWLRIRVSLKDKLTACTGSTQRWKDLKLHFVWLDCYNGQALQERNRPKAIRTLSISMDVQMVYILTVTWIKLMAKTWIPAMKPNKMYPAHLIHTKTNTRRSWVSVTNLISMRVRGHFPGVEKKTCTHCRNTNEEALIQNHSTTRQRMNQEDCLGELLNLIMTPPYLRPPASACPRAMTPGRWWESRRAREMMTHNICTHIDIKVPKIHSSTLSIS